MDLSHYESLATRAYRALDAVPTSLLAQQLPKGYVRAQITKDLVGLRKCQKQTGTLEGELLRNDLTPLFAEGIEEAARLLGVTSEPVESPARWLCSDCAVVVTGTDRDAARHLEEPGCFMHWMWELTQEAPMYAYRPTGREVHTSDGGGYYLSNHMTPVEVLARLGQKAINLVVH